VALWPPFVVLISFLEIDSFLGNGLISFVIELLLN
jgi:hypothetical protein